MHESHAHLNMMDFEFDIVATEIAATLFHVGVPPQEHQGFMAIIESFRSMVVGAADPAAVEKVHQQEAQQEVASV